MTLYAPFLLCTAPTGKTSAPKIPRPKPGDSRFTFGVDYTKPQAQKSSITWKPQPVQRPVNVAPPQPEVGPSTYRDISMACWTGPGKGCDNVCE